MTAIGDKFGGLDVLGMHERTADVGLGAVSCVWCTYLPRATKMAALTCMACKRARELCRDRALARQRRFEQPAAGQPELRVV